ncbi:hypothetical protein GUJ93_ZPchr0002g24259 [Zizania palustris]|uniref:Uncharacterized protein n=1 Tax=Zizania palustris TaxID=103762 RepID=A0A8J5RQC1_ZIZPA|nr:hypothetical protein GUJ93_ZPchr0002g26534 [Zizania palustris]KAG8058526.1 hypothetical protein GUJ93_ZPchr0002g24259 [Zizania palustris]
MAAAGGGAGGEEGSLARRAWRTYLRQLQLHPLRTKMVTSGCLAGVSDSVAQKLSGYQKIEKRRLVLKMDVGSAGGHSYVHMKFAPVGCVDVRKLILHISCPGCCYKESSA